MRADKWQFKLSNLLISAAIAGLLWFFFSTYVHYFFFILLTFWITHVRDNKSRQGELNDRMRMQLDALMANSGEEDLTYLLLEKYDFNDEADALNGD